MLKKWLTLLICLVLLCPAAVGEEARERLTEKQLLSYYDGSILVGDSITRQLRVYVLEKQKTDPEYMQGARFFVAQSYMLYTASRKYLQKDTCNLMYRGVETSLYDILAGLKPRRAVILLGVNDYVGEKTEKGIGWCERIVDLAAEASPDTEIIFESLTPVTEQFCRRKDYRTLWDEYNAALEEMCDRRGVGYIDIATPLKDENGYLPPRYSSDGKYHLKDDGLRLWLEALMDYAQAQYDAGLWTPEE